MLSSHKTLLHHTPCSFVAGSISAALRFSVLSIITGSMSNSHLFSSISGGISKPGSGFISTLNKNIEFPQLMSTPSKNFGTSQKNGFRLSSGSERGGGIPLVSVPFCRTRVKILDKPNKTVHSPKNVYLIVVWFGPTIGFLGRARNQDFYLISVDSMPIKQEVECSPWASPHGRNIHWCMMSINQNKFQWDP